MRIGDGDRGEAVHPRFKVVEKVPGEAESGISARVTMSTTAPPYSQLVWTFEDDADTDESRPAATTGSGLIRLRKNKRHP